EDLKKIKEAGTFKEERIITTPQSKKISTTKSSNVINMCANNYLGLSNNKDLIEASKDALDKWGYGLSSVRFICGTQQVHKDLEKTVSDFLETDDTILFSSCFDANGGLFETILNEEDVVISDELNHASIIDGVRLCKAKRERYKNNNMQDLREKLEEAKKTARIILIATDGVFSMDGIIADLKSICDLADEFGALVMVDDSHASGFVGKNGKGTEEYCGVIGRVDVITGTFGKALGGASGGFVSGRQEIVDLLRQKSRPYLFSNAMAPAVTASSIKAIELLQKSSALRDTLNENTEYFRKLLKENNFDIIESTHPIVPVMLYDERTAAEMASKMLEKGVYVTSFTYPVVPKGKARIRTQVSAAHTKEDLKFVVDCFVKVREEMKK
ncbi:MAG: glycine C-acetyltransferase, partial [Oscillospiraceae bacterium]